MGQRKDRFATPWRVVEMHDAFEVVNGDGVVVSRTKFKVEGDAATLREMPRNEAREIANKMVAAGGALAPLSEVTFWKSGQIRSARTSS